MLARGASAVITLPPYDRPMLARPFGLVRARAHTRDRRARWRELLLTRRPVRQEGVEQNADPGTPLGPATLVGSTFTRRYTRAEVSLDCSTLTPTIKFKADESESP